MSCPSSTNGDKINSRSPGTVSRSVQPPSLLSGCFHGLLQFQPQVQVMANLCSPELGCSVLPDVTCLSGAPALLHTVEGSCQLTCPFRRVTTPALLSCPAVPPCDSLWLESGMSPHTRMIWLLGPNPAGKTGRLWNLKEAGPGWQKLGSRGPRLSGLYFLICQLDGWLGPDLDVS